jgi:hypothetical protein
MRLWLVLAFSLPLTSISVAGSNQFRTPSGNIGCEYQPNMDHRLYCVRLKPRTDFIELDASGGRTGAYEGDLWFPDGAPILAYNTSKEFGSITCTSLETGLECRIGGRGFKANQAAIQLFDQ